MTILKGNKLSLNLNHIVSVELAESEFGFKYKDEIYINCYCFYVETVNGIKYSVFPEHIDLDFLLLKQDKREVVNYMSDTKFSKKVLDSKLSLALNYHYFWEHADAYSFEQMPEKSVFYTLIPDKEVYALRAKLNA